MSTSNEIKVSPSILSADFAYLSDEIDSIKNAEYLHFDVMDGVFVPNISIGLPVLESVREITDQTIDVHLMIMSPAKYTKRFAEAGGDIIVFHAEVETHENIINAINELHYMGKKVGLTIKPATPVDLIVPYLIALDMVLVMTVEPGFSGQKFIPEMLPKITYLREIIDSTGINCDIEVDGGINDQTGKLCVQAGANVLVAGNYIFNADDRNANIDKLKNLWR